MPLILTVGRTFSLEVTLSSLFLEAGGFCFRVALEHLRGAPLWEISRHEHGTGLTVIAGPLTIETDTTKTPGIPVNI